MNNKNKIIYKNIIKPEENIVPEKIIDLIFKDRQIKDKNNFLNPPSPLKIKLIDFDSKYQTKINKVIKLLKKIKENKETIVVYTDYDADGITGGAILWETLYLLGFKVMPHVPHRKHEGYGFSKTGIDNINKLYKPALIISVDHGITAVEEIDYAKSLGIDVIVTDHHLKSDKIPKKAKAIFHIPSLSGSGVAYFFAKEIYNHSSVILGIPTLRRKTPESNSGQARMTLLKQFFSGDYLALASIGTIADLVPLVGPSRSLVKFGLETFPKIKRHGLCQILKDAGIGNRKITTYEVGFMIAPRINASGRLEHAIEALRLLCTKDQTRASQLAKHLGVKNRERQDMVEKAVNEAKKSIINDQLSMINKLIILVSEHWHEGIIGLIASKITEEFYRPTIVITKSGEVYKGSARSINNFHITNFLRDLKKYLIGVGGHKGAAGFSIEEKKIKQFCETALKKSRTLIKDKDLEKKVKADLKIPLSKINIKLVKLLEQLEPYGIGNPRPKFYSQGELVDAKIFGKNNQHLKLWVKDIKQSPINNSPLELISFNSADQFAKLSRGQMIDVVYSLEVDRWRKNEIVRGKLIK